MTRPLLPSVSAARARANAARAAHMEAHKGALAATEAALADNARRYAEARLQTMAELGNAEKPALEGRYPTGFARPGLHIIRTRFGDYEARDAGGEVARIGFDAQTQEWWIAANIDRYAMNVDLPKAFGGFASHTVSRFGDVFRFFDLPLPGASELAEVSREG